MSKIRQIFRLHSQGQSSRQIGILLNCSRNTVRKYTRRFADNRLMYEDIEQMSDHELEALFSPEIAPQVKGTRLEQLQVLLPDIEKHLKRKGVTLDLAWKQYKALYPDGYASAQFYRYYRAFVKCGNPVMHIEHKYL